MKAVVLALVNAYVSGEISFRDFHDWFIPATWDMRRFTDPSVVKIIYGVQLALAEFFNGDWTEPELKVELASLPEAPRPQLYMGEPPLITGSSAAPLEEPVAVGAER